MSTEAELDELVQVEAADFLRRATAGLFVAYDAAGREAKAEHDAPERKNVVGYLRRSKFETEFRNAGSLSGLSSAVVVAKMGTWTHSEVRSTSMVFTASRVDYPCAVVHPAHFRKSLAETGQQCLIPDECSAPADSIFAIVTHSASVWPTAEEHQKWGHLPGSSHLAFPVLDPSKKKGHYFYLHTIDLFRMFPEVVRQATPQEWDEPMRVRFLERGRRQYAEEIA